MPVPSAIPPSSRLSSPSPDSPRTPPPPPTSSFTFSVDDGGRARLQFASLEEVKRSASRNAPLRGGAQLEGEHASCAGVRRREEESEADAALLRQYSSLFSPSPKRWRNDERATSSSAGAPWSLRPIVKDGRMRLEQKGFESYQMVKRPPAPLPSTPTPLPSRHDPSTCEASVSDPSSGLGPALSPSAPVASPPSSADAPPSSLPDRLSRILQHPEQLPTGLLALLEACVEEGERGGPETTSVLAMKVGLVGDKATERERVVMPPPPVPSRLHKRSVSSPSVLSVVGEIGAVGRADASRLGDRDPQTRAFQPLMAAALVCSSSRCNVLPPLPSRPHPAYPPNFARPLQFVYETGEEGYEDQRINRNAIVSTSAARSSISVGASGPAVHTLRQIDQRTIEVGRTFGWAAPRKKRVTSWYGKVGEEDHNHDKVSSTVRQPRRTASGVGGDPAARQTSPRRSKRLKVVEEEVSFPV